MRKSIRRYLLSVVFILAVLILALPAKSYAGGKRRGIDGYFRPCQVCTRDYITSKKGKNQVIFVGDSRLAWVAYYIETGRISRKDFKDCCFVFGRGLRIDSLLNEKGVFCRQLKAAVKKHPQATVVFNFGCNGNGNPSRNFRKCVKAYRLWMNKKICRKNHFMVASVLPTRGTRVRTPSYYNSKITELNAMLKQYYSKKHMYIPVAEQLLEKQMVDPKTGAGMVDDLHYKLAPSKMYMKFIARKARESY